MGVSLHMANLVSQARHSWCVQGKHLVTLDKFSWMSQECWWH